MELVSSSDGTPIAYERRGSGPPLVLIGGALSDRTAAAELAERLAQGFATIAYDRRGRGDSGDTPPYSVEREVDDIAALLEVLGGSASLFGHSSGGALALEAARTLGPSSVPHVAVYEPPFIVDDSRPLPPPNAAERIEQLVENGRRGDAVEFFLLTGPMVAPEALAEVRASPSWPDFEAVAHTIAYDFRVLGDTMQGSTAPLAHFASVTVPTLVLDGGASPPWQRSATQALARVLPRAVHRSLPGQTHGAEPDVLAPVLSAFFQDAPLP